MKGNSMVTENVEFLKAFSAPEKEKALLGALVAQPGNFWKVVEILPQEAFFEAEHHQVFQEISKAIQGGTPLPSLEVESTHLPVEELANELLELYQKRLLVGVVGKLSEWEYIKAHPAKKLLLELAEEVGKAQQVNRELQSSRMFSIGELVPGIISEMQKRWELRREGKAFGIPISENFGKLNSMFGGLQPGIHCLAAAPGCGKTSLAIQMACETAMLGWPVVFISFEEDVARLALKGICYMAELVATDYEKGNSDVTRLAEAAGTYGKQLCHLHFQQGTKKLDLPQVKAKALQAMNRASTEKCLVLVDYLQKWAAVKKDFSDFRHNVASLVGDLRELSLNLKSPVLMISNLARDAYKEKKPGETGQGRQASMAHLKESGDIEFACDSVLVMEKIPRQNSNTTPPARDIKLSIDKNRYGDTGAIDLVFFADKGKFEVPKK